MNCLNCGQEMRNISVQTKRDEIAYDTCETCGSLWLDAGELDKMAFQVAGSIEFCTDERAEDSGERPRACPRCPDVRLDKVRFLGMSDVVLDRCENCGGFWLDGGELDLVNRELEDIMPVEGKGFSEFVNNLHVPYWHKRISRKSSATDFQAEVPPIKHAIALCDTGRCCPACKSGLTRYRVYGIEIEACSGCRGVWLDKGELRMLKDRVQKGTWRDLRWMDDELEAMDSAHAFPSDRRCPACEDNKLVTLSFGGSKVLMDCCRSCGGTWLDAGEFQAIVDHLNGKLDELPPDEMRQKLARELKEVWTGEEGLVSELADVKVAVSALLNLTLLQHPRLVNFLLSVRIPGA